MIRCRIVSAEPGGLFSEEIVSGGAGGRFETIPGAGRNLVHPPAAHVAGHAEPPAEVDNQRLVVVRVRGPQLMIEMCHTEPPGPTHL